MNKKKKIIITISILVCIISLIIIFLLTSIKQNDWHYKLNNNYEIWHINTKETIIGKREKDILTTIIDDNIIEFKYNDNYVIIKCLNTNKKEIYYIINIKDDTTYGPYTKEECLSKEKELNININTWIKTKNTPKKANYN